MKRIFLVILALALCACAKKMETPAPAAPDALAARWQEMVNISHRDAGKPYRLQTSLRFGREGDTRRVTAILWGNNETNLRMDVMAGVGAVIAKIADNGNDFLLFDPRAGKAYFVQGKARPLLKMGVPLPFSLGQVALLLNGRYIQVFGAAHTAGRMLENGAAAYTLEAKPGGELELNARGLPVSWRMADGWTLTFGHDDGDLPQSLKLNGPDAKMAILLVKEREIPATDFDASQLRLTIPDNIPLLPFSQYRPK